ncbi:MAG: transporter substrate-binding protein [Treponema sp.]|nr:transporter substrate-binding protein [Treponema sp.]
MLPGAVRIASKDLEYDAPEEKIRIDGTNQHTYKSIRIGKINSDISISEVWNSKTEVRPDPCLSAYAWARGL